LSEIFLSKLVNMFLSAVACHFSHTPSDGDHGLRVVLVKDA
jgi:hypothetical protein